MCKLHKRALLSPPSLSLSPFPRLLLCLHARLHLCKYLLHATKLGLLLLQYAILLVERSTRRTSCLHRHASIAPIQLINAVLLALNALGQTIRAIVLVVHLLSDLLQVLHVCYQHGPQLDEVTMLGILHLDHAPRIEATTHLLALDLEQSIGAADGKRHCFLQLLHLLLVVFVLIGITVGQWIYLDAMAIDLLHNAALQSQYLLLCQTIRLGNNRHNVYLRVQLLHELHVQRLQSANGNRMEYLLGNV